MTVDTIFGNEGGDPTIVTTPPETKDQGLLPSLVGESQKYKSAEELAKAYVNADEFINQLKEENRKLREQAASAKTIDEVLERISKTDSKAADPLPALSKEDVAAYVEQTLTGRELVKQRESNLLEADKLMKEKFGTKAAEVFKAKATTPELQQVYMELASKSPNDFVALFAGVTAPTTPLDSSSVSTTLTTASSGNRAAQEGTKEWAAKMRKEQPDIYWSSAFQTKLQQIVTKNPSLYFGN
jgi:hypothetical protein